VRTYSKGDFEQIAAAIGKGLAHVIRYENRFEAAATWYRLNAAAPQGKSLTLSMTSRVLKQIANTARRLLSHLEVYNHRNAPDGPGDRALLESLASADEGTEDEITRATAQIGRLMEIFDAMDGARCLERCARKAANDTGRISKLIVPRGRRGDRVLNIWLADMMGLYKALTGKTPRVSTITTGPNRGKATGPFVRFLQAASKPVSANGNPLRLKSLHERVRAISKAARRQK
jgi:hypothetical protein